MEADAPLSTINCCPSESQWIALLWVSFLVVGKASTIVCGLLFRFVFRLYPNGYPDRLDLGPGVVVMR